MYISAKAHLITGKVESIGKKMSVAIVFYPKDEISIVYLAFLTISDEVFSPCRVSIILLRVDIASITVPLEYFKFTNIIFLEPKTELPEHMEIKNQAMNFIDSNQSSYAQIYSSQPIQVKILNTSI